MSYTASEMPSPKGSYFKITYAKGEMSFNTSCLHEMINWARQYKSTLCYGFNRDDLYAYHYLAVSEEKSVANLVTLIKNALVTSRPSIVVELIKTKEEFMKFLEEKGYAEVIPFPMPPVPLEEQVPQVKAGYRRTINMSISQYETIDSAPAVPLDIDEIIDRQLKTMTDPVYYLKTYDIQIPFNKETGIPDHGCFYIPIYLNMILSGISVSSGDFSFEFNLAQRGQSTNGHLDLTHKPGKSDATTAELQQEALAGVEEKLIQEIFKDADGRPKHRAGKWFNSSNTKYAMLRNLTPDTIITLHGVRLFLQDKYKIVCVNNLVERIY
jgi:hypothetical protein